MAAHESVVLARRHHPGVWVTDGSRERRGLWPMRCPTLRSRFNRSYRAMSLSIVRPPKRDP